MTFDEWYRTMNYWPMGDKPVAAAEQAWNHQQARIDETQNMLDGAIRQIGIYKNSIDAHNARCDEVCDKAAKDGKCPAVKGMSCPLCPRKRKIEE